MKTELSDCNSEKELSSDFWDISEDWYLFFKTKFKKFKYIQTSFLSIKQLNQIYCVVESTDGLCRNLWLNQMKINYFLKTEVVSTFVHKHTPPAGILKGFAVFSKG